MSGLLDSVKSAFSSSGEQGGGEEDGDEEFFFDKVQPYSARDYASPCAIIYLRYTKAAACCISPSTISLRVTVWR